MSEAWILVGVVGVATVALKGAGAALVGGRPLPRRAAAVVGLLAPALLAALVVVQAVSDRQAVVADARLIGLGAAVTAILLRAPTLVVVLVAAAAAAGARALGVP